MPVGSDMTVPVPQGGAAPASLPHTWRPFGVRVALAFFGVMLVVFCTFAWFGIDPEIRAKVTLFERLTFVFLTVLAGSVAHALTRSRIVATEGGVEVVNGYRRHTYEWAEIVSIHLSGGAPWASLDLADGTTMSVLALQGSDGDRARKAVRELRTLIDR